MRLRSILAIVSILSVAVCAHGDTIAEFTGGTGAINLSTYDGQAFLVLGAANYTNITFNFYTPSGSAYAVGTAYLFSSPYMGTPAGLSSAPGPLGSAIALGGEYNFGSSVTLTAGDTYYLFEDSVIPAGAMAGASPTVSEFYQAAGPDDIFGSIDATANYLVTGTPVTVGVAPTPEPSSLILLCTGMLGSLAALRSARKRDS